MAFIQVTRKEPLAVVTLSRGKVNAFNDALTDELTSRLTDLERDGAVRAVILTGAGPFFSFGLDVPELYSYSPEDFTAFLLKFTSLYKRMFLFPKPIVAAVNGHSTAGGCMLSNACDYRIMASGKAKISLNEITFGSAVFQSSIEILKFWVGGRRAQEVLLEGRMYAAEDARVIGLVDAATSPETLASEAEKVARRYVERHSPAYSQIKKMLRDPVIAASEPLELKRIDEFVEIWYSREVREKLKGVTIR
jgi:enoyl-CoA hydratase/carnithine racemase